MRACLEVYVNYTCMENDLESNLTSIAYNTFGLAWLGYSQAKPIGGQSSLIILDSWPGKRKQARQSIQATGHVGHKGNVFGSTTWKHC